MGTYSILSVRKGALVLLAQRGLDTATLQVVSHHRRRDTLLRYLAWGAFDATAATAARAAARIRDLPSGAGPASFPAPPVVGLYSGRVGSKGRRVAPPPGSGFRPPSAHDLGLDPPPADVTSWPLHVKRVDTICYHDVLAVAASLDAGVAGRLQEALRWVTDPSCLRPEIAGRTPAAFPFARITESQAETLLEFGKLQAVEASEALAHCSGWLLPQPKKTRLRPIFEPATNATLQAEHLPPCLFIPRAEMRRRFAANAGYACQIDLAAYYDQLPLPAALRPYYCIRVRTTEGGSRYFALTRVPMGARWSCGFAAAISDVLAAAASRPCVDVQTCIDNVRISSNDPAAFILALRSLAAVTAKLRLAVGELNEKDSTTDDFVAWVSSRDDVVLEDCRRYARDHIWLGERNMRDARDRVVFANTTASVEKLQAAWNRIAAARDPEGHVAPSISRRHVVSLIGLIFWMAHVGNIPMANCWVILRLASAIGFAATSDGGWDRPVAYLSDRVACALADIVALLVANHPRPPLSPQPPSTDPNDYDAIVCVDASAVGWAAVVWWRYTDPDGQTVWRATEVSAGWSATVAAQHSAHAEPLAVDHALEFVEHRFGRNANIAFMTDHRAIVAGARRHADLHGGFSPSSNLNSLYARAYAHQEDIRVPPRRDFFYIPGNENISDATSRIRGRGPWLREVPIDMDMPPLAALWFAG